MAIFGLELENLRERKIIIQITFYTAKEEVKNCTIQPAKYIWHRPGWSGVGSGRNESHSKQEKNKFEFIF